MIRQHISGVARGVRNKRALGVDGITVRQLPDILKARWPEIKHQLLQGCYRPQPVRRVQIPKPALLGQNSIVEPPAVAHPNSGRPPDASCFAGPLSAVPLHGFNANPHVVGYGSPHWCRRCWWCGRSRCKRTAPDHDGFADRPTTRGAGLAGMVRSRFSHEPPS